MINGKFRNKGGHEYQLKRAQEIFIEGQTYEVECAEVSGWSTSVEFKDIEGSFNSVMFDYTDENGNEVDIVEAYIDTFMWD